MQRLSCGTGRTAAGSPHAPPGGPSTGSATGCTCLLHPRTPKGWCQLSHLPSSIARRHGRKIARIQEASALAARTGASASIPAACNPHGPHGPVQPRVSQQAGLGPSPGPRDPGAAPPRTSTEQGRPPCGSVPPAGQRHDRHTIGQAGQADAAPHGARGGAARAPHDQGGGAAHLQHAGGMRHTVGQEQRQEVGQARGQERHGGKGRAQAVGRRRLLLASGPLGAAAAGLALRPGEALAEEVRGLVG